MYACLSNEILTTLNASKILSVRRIVISSTNLFNFNEFQHVQISRVQWAWFCEMRFNIFYIVSSLNSAIEPYEIANSANVPLMLFLRCIKTTFIFAAAAYIAIKPAQFYINTLSIIFYCQTHETILSIKLYWLELVCSNRTFYCIYFVIFQIPCTTAKGV